MATYGTLTWVGHALAPLTGGITEDLIRVTEQMIPVDDIAADLGDMRAASIAENIAAVQYVLANNIDPATVGPPPGAAAYAQRLARRGVPLTVLLRAYGLGQYRLLDAAIGLILATPGIDHNARIAELLRFASIYLDRLNSSMGRIYEAERDRWLSSRQAARQQWIARLLDSDDVDVPAAEEALEYRLDRSHLAVEIWTPPTVTGVEATRALEQARQVVVSALRTVGRGLVASTGDRALRIWFPTEGEQAIDDLTAQVVASGLPVRVALGSLGEGLPGFRRSTRNAARAKDLAVSAGHTAPPVVAYDAVAPFALLTDDPDELAALVRRTLGPLAGTGAKKELLRDTLDVFLTEGASYSRTARALDVHRNTIQYRIQQITTRYGITLDTNSFDLRFALGICRWHPHVLTRTF
ncbi:PucR family transcriptional regulator [Nocardia rosealba]|uniref:PucR family transcriptional regulator n=1 Tax=Nocardia rosealba TaxID=2878563 RepID=UPI001CD9CB28|nr:helix-turn-helix domain-containing protein [Nocardia rosealba]MCA2207595.1 helix-turn-helix domain-containing protein [Nocardia rosealba]